MMFWPILKVNSSIKEWLSRVTSTLSTFMNLASPLFDRNKTTANTNDVETGTNATVNSINNPNHEQSETLRNEDINQYQTQIDQLRATNEQERKVGLIRLGIIT